MSRSVTSLVHSGVEFKIVNMMHAFLHMSLKRVNPGSNLICFFSPLCLCLNSIAYIVEIDLGL